MSATGRSLAVLIFMFLITETVGAALNKTKSRRGALSHCPPEPLHMGGYSWKNNFDGALSWNCGSNGLAINRIISVHSNCFEDRVFAFFCNWYAGKFNNEGDCAWTKDYLNDYDKELEYRCPNNGFINGFQSVHDNKKEDRKWKIHCCSNSGYAPKDCEETDYINDWDEDFEWNVPHGKFIVGAYSKHDNRKEDRRWKFTICKSARKT